LEPGALVVGCERRLNATRNPPSVWIKIHQVKHNQHLDISNSTTTAATAMTATTAMNGVCGGGGCGVGGGSGAGPVVFGVLHGGWAPESIGGVTESLEEVME
jgi:hypothetical protein